MNAKPQTPAARGRKRLYTLVVVIALAGLVVFFGRPQTPPEFPPLPDFAAYNQIADMKAAFIDYLTPIIEYQNTRILEDRARLEQITDAVMNGRFVFWFDRDWLKQLAEKYDVAWKEDDLSAVLNELLGRVDIIPVSLVVVQAAKESSWGQSRFAVEGNNLFGHWCFDEDCGIEPEQRPAGATHQVRKFKSVSNAVRSYLHNLNTHDGYADLRRLRQRLRNDRQPITGMALAEGLLLYSERREAYVEEVKTMIQQYHAFKNARAE